MSEPLVTFMPIGRLGNVMFQTAAAIGYAKRHNVKWGVPSNTREVPEFHKWFPGLPICNMQYRSYQEHPAGMCRHHNQHYDDCHYNYHPIPFVHGGVKLMGFFQSWKYFEGAENEVRAAFKLKEYPELKDYVSIHVRRGDYVQHAESFPPVTVEYIGNAMNEFKKEWTQKFLVFSDDINWCRANIIEAARYRGNIVAGVNNGIEGDGWTIEFSEGNDTYTDLCMMASCGHNIIANSSFSWWAAWLNQNPDKIVISPSHKRGQWFGLRSGVKQDCVDLIPPTWHQIEFR